MSAEGQAETAPFGFRVACARVLGDNSVTSAPEPPEPGRVHGLERAAGCSFRWRVWREITMHFHDQRMRRLASAGMLPERAGQPVKVWVHIPLAGLPGMDGSTTLVHEWVTAMRAAWAAHRAAASEGGGNIGA
jgi:hypothetical protein